jgi:hypothetical protein
MLKVNGLIVLPKDMDLREAEVGKNMVITFNACGLNPNRPDQDNKYPIEVWVPHEEVSKLKAKLKYNNRFFVSGTWSALEKEWNDKTVVYHKLICYYKDLNLLRPNSWYADPEDKT